MKIEIVEKPKEPKLVLPEVGQWWRRFGSPDAYCRIDDEQGRNAKAHSAEFAACLFYSMDRRGVIWSTDRAIKGIQLLEPEGGTLRLVPVMGSMPALAPVKKQPRRRWVNIYPNGVWTAHETRELAAAAGGGHVECIEVVEVVK